MKYNIDESVIARSVDHYGEEIQSTVCMEECAELIQAISKAKRGKINRDNMIEEIADVFIVLVSICNRLNINLYDAIKKKEEKNIKRQWKVNEGEKNEQ